MIRIDLENVLKNSRAGQNLLDWVQQNYADDDVDNTYNDLISELAGDIEMEYLEQDNIEPSQDIFLPADDYGDVDCFDDYDDYDGPDNYREEAYYGDAHAIAVLHGTDYDMEDE